jgi:hypothetical protein
MGVDQFGGGIGPEREGWQITKCKMERGYSALYPSANIQTSCWAQVHNYFCRVEARLQQISNGSEKLIGTLISPFSKLLSMTGHGMITEYKGSLL